MSHPPIPTGAPSPTPKPSSTPDPRTPPVDADTAIKIAKTLDGAVFPLNADKTPRLPGSWPEYSTVDEAGIRRLWGMAGGLAYVGLDCGKSAMVVIDVDDPSGLPSALLDALAGVETLILRSLYRGGNHHYFRGTYAGRTIPGGDIKAAGGYVLVSVDADMHRADIADLPASIVTLFDLRVPGVKAVGAAAPAAAGWEAWLDEHNGWMDSEDQAEAFVQEVLIKFRLKVTEGEHRRMAARDAIWSASIEVAAGVYPGWMAYESIGRAYREMRDLDPNPSKRWTAQREEDYKVMWAGAIAKLGLTEGMERVEKTRLKHGIGDDPYLVSIPIPEPPPISDGGALKDISPGSEVVPPAIAPGLDSESDSETAPAGVAAGVAAVATEPTVAPEIVTLPAPEPVTDGWVEDGITLPKHLRLYRKGDLHGTVSPLGDGAFHGPLGEILKVLDGEVEAQTESVAAALLPLLGAWFGRDITLKVGSVIYHPANLFVALVGPTGRARKGTAQKAADTVMRLIDTDFLANNTSGGFGSGQSLVHYLRDPMFDSEGMLKAGRYDQRLCIREAELARTFATVHAEGSVMSHVLREAFDHTHALATTALTTGIGVRSSSHHVSLFGAITPEELVASFGGLSSVNGLGNRFMWVWADKRIDLPDGDAIDLDRLRDICDRIRSDALVGERSVYLADDVRERWRSEDYSRLKDFGELPDIGGMLARASDLVMRTALVYAAVSGSTLVEMAHYEAGLAYEVRSRESVAACLGGMVAGELPGRVLSHLRLSPGVPVAKTDLWNALGRNVTVAALDAALSGLERTGLVHRFRGSTGAVGGRPPVLIVATIARR